MSNHTIEVFISYSKQDKELRDGLLAHLRPLETQGIITWHDRQILPGTRWDDEIKARLNAADIILLLISADFLNTDYCMQVEIPEALRRHEAGEATVMPVILRQCGWKYTLLAEIQAYPEKAKPIKSWTDIDEAYTNVVDGVYLAAKVIKEQRIQRQREEQEKFQQEVAKERQQQQVKQPSPAILRGNYAQLESLLNACKWQEADRETDKWMCKVMGRHAEDRLREEHIKKFPCADLYTIDRLWLNYSDGKFGFSAQKQIWQEVKENFLLFSDYVGWRVNRSWIKAPQYTSIIPKGHLPSLDFFDVTRAYETGLKEIITDAPTISWLVKKGAISSISLRLLTCDNL